MRLSENGFVARLSENFELDRAAIRISVEVYSLTASYSPSFAERTDKEKSNLFISTSISNFTMAVPGDQSGTWQ